jgi:hypothetical protein
MVLLHGDNMVLRECDRATRDDGVSFCSGILWNCVYAPNSEVRMLPDTADSIFWPSVTSPMPADLSASSALCVAVAIGALLFKRGCFTSNRCEACCMNSKGAKRAAWASSWCFASGDGGDGQ